jgi:hypothetical protein
MGAARAVLRGKFTAINTYIKEERLHKKHNITPQRKQRSTK